VGTLLDTIWSCRLDNPTATLIGLTKDNFQVQQAVVLSLASPVPVADPYLQRVEVPPPALHTYFAESKQ